MADRIAQIAAANADTRALMEEGLREQYKADNREIPQNFIDMVHTITALISEYGVNNLSKKNKIIFDVYSSVQSTIVSGTQVLFLVPPYKKCSIKKSKYCN